MPKLGRSHHAHPIASLRPAVTSQPYCLSYYLWRNLLPSLPGYQLRNPLHPEERCPVMTNPTIDLDQHRGMAAQKATELRRLMAAVAADSKALRERQDELEAQLAAAPAETWVDAAEKARYLLGLFVTTPVAQDPRRQTLIANVLEDFRRLGLPD